MNKKIIAIIIAVIVILLGVYQFVYVPYQNEQAIKNYNEGLQNVSAIDDEINETNSKLNNESSINVTEGIDLTIKTLKEITPKVDEQIEKLNETRAYANGNETKEKYIDYQIQCKQIEKEMMSDMTKEYEELGDAYKNMDITKIMSASQKIQDTFNSKADEMVTVRDNIINLLNDNPEFNQTVHDLNLSDDFYGNMNLTHI